MGGCQGTSPSGSRREGEDRWASRKEWKWRFSWQTSLKAVGLFVGSSSLQNFQILGRAVVLGSDDVFP